MQLCTSWLHLSMLLTSLSLLGQVGNTFAMLTVRARTHQHQAAADNGKCGEGCKRGEFLLFLLLHEAQLFHVSDVYHILVFLTCSLLLPGEWTSANPGNPCRDCRDCRDTVVTVVTSHHNISAKCHILRKEGGKKSHLSQLSVQEKQKLNFIN